MSLETNKALIQREFEAWNTGDTNWFKQYVAPTFRGYHPAFPDGITGIEGYSTWFETTHTMFSDLHATIDELVAEGDAVVVRFTFTGTNTGPLIHYSTPTGKPVSFICMYVCHIADGKLVAMWFTYDTYGVFQQLGLVPPLGAPAA